MTIAVHCVVCADSLTSSTDCGRQDWEKAQYKKEKKESQLGSFCFVLELAHSRKSK